jgi:hypothetical protein
VLTLAWYSQTMNASAHSRYDTNSTRYAASSLSALVMNAVALTLSSDSTPMCIASNSAATPVRPITVTSAARAMNARTRRSR